eukprot:6063621-Amphidinium_carterae.1
MFAVDVTIACLMRMLRNALATWEIVLGCQALRSRTSLYSVLQLVHQSSWNVRSANVCYPLLCDGKDQMHGIGTLFIRTIRRQQKYKIKQRRG